MVSFLNPGPDTYMCKDVNRGKDAHFLETCLWQLLP